MTSRLPGLIQTDIAELDFEAGGFEPGPKRKPDPDEGPDGPSGNATGSDGCSISGARTASLGWIALSFVAMWLARRRTAR
ncbi:MAG: hypothetical protein WCE62_00200 [Polyangiales bacterium]